MGKVELVFLGIILGALIIGALYLFGSVMFNIGKMKAKKEVKKKKA